LHVASGGKLVLESGAILSNQGANSAASVTFTPATGTTNQTLVSIQVNDAAGAAITTPVLLTVWLSDAASGAGLTATTASGAVAAGASGADFGTLTSKKALVSQTTATGLYILAITDTSKTGFYPAVEIGGKAFVGAQLLTANYG
jgi:hypothetical protein